MTVSGTTSISAGANSSGKSAIAVGTAKDDIPHFSLTEDRYDQTTYYGRFRKMLDIVDPRTLLCSKQDLDEAVKLLNDFEGQQKQTSGNATNYKQFDDEKLWHAKKLRDAIIHPDTNEIIPRPLRMSGWLPYNGPICVGALMATTTPWILFFQWANQTQNALVNYANRNATQPQDMSTVLAGYFGAVGGAVGVSVGLKTAIERSRRLSLAQKLSAQRFVALPGIVAAAIINVVLMRQSELATGIDVYYEPKTESGTTKASTTVSSPVVVGPSQLAAQKALKEMIFSRMILPLPTFLAPPIALTLLDPILRKNRHHWTLPLSATFVLLGFGLGLPATIAIFPQTGTVEASDLEEKFQHLKDEQGNPVTVFRYNKGL